MDLDLNRTHNQPLLHVMNKIYKNLNKSTPEVTLGIFLDLKKAFNCFDLDILLKKTYSLWFQKCGQNLV